MADPKGQKGRRRSRTKPELNASIELRRIETRGIVLAQIVRWVGLIGVTFAFSYFGVFKPVEVLAGQATFATIDLGMLVRFGMGGAATVFGGGGLAYGWRQRKLRRDTVQEMGKRIAELEKLVDPNRSSSGLTLRGDTHPRDAI